MSKTSIEWTEQTWNPIVGCSIVSPGCTNCYAMKMAARIEAMGNQPRYAGTTRKVNGNTIWTGKLAQAPDSVLLAPLKRKKPTTYFVNSMGDLFHEDCPDEWIDKVFAVMALSPQHTFQVLTKRAARMKDYCGRLDSEPHGDTARRIVAAWPGNAPVPVAGITFPLPNVWLGVSAERQQEADERIPLLLQTPAAIRFISAEPLLGPIDLTVPDIDLGIGRYKSHTDLDWVIVGGESGAKARFMDQDWARSLRDQCRSARVPFFFKQWGEWEPGDGDCVGQQYYKVGKKRAGRLLDGVEHNGMPS